MDKRKRGLRGAGCRAFDVLPCWCISSYMYIGKEVLDEGGPDKPSSEVGL
jgi:hypothetical protein